MKKLRFTGIIFSLFLIVMGIIGFTYLINIDGAGPELSWTVGMGPLAIGFIILTVSTRKGEAHGN